MSSDFERRCLSLERDGENDRKRTAAREREKERDQKAMQRLDEQLNTDSAKQILVQIVKAAEALHK